MRNLPELQGELWRAIATRPGTLAASDALLAVTTASSALDAAARLQVYADAYFWRLRDVLVEDFPRLVDAVGFEAFEEIARDYLRAHPSTNPSVRHLGDALPAYLAARGDLAPHLADLARLERARTDAFDAPDATPIDDAALRAVPPETWPLLRFRAIPALRVLRLAWPVHLSWSTPAAAPAAPAPTALRVWRGDEYRVFHAPLEPRAATALERLAAGEPFATICAAFGDLPPGDAAREATALLARWLADGTIAAVDAA
jgi:hypothetical protein